MLLGYVKRKDLIRWLVICTTEPSDEGTDPSDAPGPDGPPGRRPSSRIRRKRKAGRKAGEDDSDEEYVMGHRGIKRREGWLLGEGLGEGEGKNLVGKTYGTFWGREDKGLGSGPMISEEEVQYFAIGHSHVLTLVCRHYDEYQKRNELGLLQHLSLPIFLKLKRTQTCSYSKNPKRKTINLVLLSV